jgi:hypothetical protein
MSPLQILIVWLEESDNFDRVSYLILYRRDSSSPENLTLNPYNRNFEAERLNTLQNSLAMVILPLMMM